MRQSEPAPPLSIKGSPLNPRDDEGNPMAVTELEHTELANRLVQAIGTEAAETLMQCIIPEGRDQLATKDDLKVLESTLRNEFAEFKVEMRSEFAEFKGEIKSDLSLVLAKQTRMYLTTLAGFMLTTWGALIVPAFV